MPKVLFRQWLSFGIMAVALSTTGRAGTTIITNHPFVGVIHYQRTQTSPRPLVMHILEIDLGAPGLSFAVTPPNGTKPGDTTRQRTSDFVAEVGAQIGINGTFYTLAGSGPGPGGGTEYYADLTYFAYSGGNPVSTWSGTGDPDERGINVEPDNSTYFIKPYNVNHADYEVRPVGVIRHNAIASYDGILINSVIEATDANLHPRTAMGLRNKSTLFLFVVDGRWPGYSEGMTTIEIAELLQSDYGVTDAINLDGGGSTTLVFADPTVRVLNLPSDGVERLQGCNFAVFATVPQRPAFVPGSLQGPTNGCFQFTLSGSAGASYEILHSADLETWDLLRLLTLTNSTSVCVDTNASNACRYYRARLVP